MGAVTRSVADPKVAGYIQASQESYQELIHALREIVFAAEPGMEEAIKWNRITYTLNANWHHCRSVERPDPPGGREADCDEARLVTSWPVKMISSPSAKRR